MTRSLPSSYPYWKLLLLSIALLVGVEHLWGLLYQERRALPQLAGTLGVTMGEFDAEYRRPIVAMLPTSPLALAGAQIGDTIAFERYGDSARRLGTDEQLNLMLHSGKRESPLTIRPIPDPAVAAHPAVALTTAAIRWLIGAMTLGFGVMIGLRRADSMGMRALALALITVAVDNYTWILPSGAVQDWSLRFLWPLAYFVAFVAFPYFTLTLPEERPLMRNTWVRYGFRLFAGAWSAALLWWWLDSSQLLPWSWRSLAATLPWGRALALGTFVISVVASWYAWRRSAGEVRQRMAWIGICLCTTYLVFSAPSIAALLHVKFDGLMRSFVGQVLLLLSYSGLGYAILRHRIFNFGFAVNRALVYSIISTILLLTFAVTEWVVDKLLHFQGREKNVIFDAFVALGIILSFHRIQHWVSHRVDHTFFHHWYEAAEKLRQFVDRAAHITQPDALQLKFIQAVQTFAALDGCAVYVLSADGGLVQTHSTLVSVPAAFDADDDTLIALRHARGMVELAPDAPNAMAQLAFPMLVRGQLSGMLLAGPKQSGLHLRPDEIALIASTTHSIGLNLESLRVEELERNAASLRQENAALKLGHDAVRARAEVAELKLSLQAVGA